MLFLLAALLMAHPHAALAQDYSIAPRYPESPACVQDPNNPFDPGKIMTTGKYVGQCADTRGKWPVELLHEDADSFVVANLVHDGKYWIARIPRDEVQQVIFRIERFGTGIPLITAAHTLLGFKMKPGSELQLTEELPSNATRAPETTTTDGFYLSIEYLAPKGVQYGIIQGMHPNFLATYHFISLAYRDAGGGDPGHPPEDLPLSMDQDSMNRLLDNVVLVANERGDDFVYNTLNFNCTTTLFDLMDQTLDYGSKRIKPFRESRWHIFNPVAGPAEKALRKRGLITKKTRPIPPEGSRPSNS